MCVHAGVHAVYVRVHANVHICMFGLNFTTSTLIHLTWISKQFHGDSDPDLGVAHAGVFVGFECLIIPAIKRIIAPSWLINYLDHVQKRWHSALRPHFCFMLCHLLALCMHACGMTNEAKYSCCFWLCHKHPSMHDAWFSLRGTRESWHSQGLLYRVS